MRHSRKYCIATIETVSSNKMKTITLNKIYKIRKWIDFSSEENILI